MRQIYLINPSPVNVYMNYSAQVRLNRPDMILRQPAVYTKHSLLFLSRLNIHSLEDNRSFSSLNTVKVISLLSLGMWQGPWHDMGR